MPLESLFELVETLRGRVETYGNALQSSEALTRYALIDPLLRELGWDTSDPAMVAPEYRSGSGSADYALLSNGSPAMMVEAKKLGTPLQDQVLAQGINYCLIEGTNHFAVTDGARWDIYETHKPVPIDQKRVAEFDLINQPPAEFCLKALALWRPSVQAGYVEPGHAPIVAMPDAPPTPEVAQPAAAQLATVGDGWQTLDKVSPERGDQPPEEILFPDGRRTDMKYWGDMLVETVRWLTNRRELTDKHCPIQIGRANSYVVHTEPVHSHGVKFRRSTEVNGLYVERDTSARRSIPSVQAIITRVGQDPAQFKVRFD